MSVGLVSLVVAGRCCRCRLSSSARSARWRPPAGDARNLHSLPGYYGWYGAPVDRGSRACCCMLVWLLVQPICHREPHRRDCSRTWPSPTTPPARWLMADVRRVAGGLDAAVAQGALTEDEARRHARRLHRRARPSGRGRRGAWLRTSRPQVLAAAQDYRELTHWGAAGATVACPGRLPSRACFCAVPRITPDFRARNRVGTGSSSALLIAASLHRDPDHRRHRLVAGVRDLSTSSRMYPVAGFLLRPDLDPATSAAAPTSASCRCSGARSTSRSIAMLVAVPIGLFSAIYLSEYASPARPQPWSSR